MPFQLPELPFAKDALAPHMSRETLDFHHGKHHLAYVTKTNELLRDERELSGSSLARVIREAHRAGHSTSLSERSQHPGRTRSALKCKPAGFAIVMCL